MSARFNRQSQRWHGISTLAVILLVVLLVLPALAILGLTRSFDPRILIGYLVVVSCVTFWLYWRDRRSAESGRWRTPESTLHIAELLGGWPAAFIAQRILRHKISKTRYLVVFWIIVAFHEVVSFEFLSGCHWSRAAIGFLYR